MISRIYTTFGWNSYFNEITNLLHGRMNCRTQRSCTTVHYLQTPCIQQGMPSLRLNHGIFRFYIHLHDCLHCVPQVSESLVDKFLLNRVLDCFQNSKPIDYKRLLKAHLKVIVVVGNITFFAVAKWFTPSTFVVRAR